jgi:EAL and modified HD-GYP domain-containing signal transduction protein
MQEHPVLGQVALGYSPMIDRQRAVVATRLTIFPERPDAAPDAQALYAALQEVWPAPEADAPLQLKLRPLNPAAVDQRGAATAAAAGSAGGASAPVSLNIAGEAMLHAVMHSQPPTHLMIEVPAFMASDPANLFTLRELHAAGTPLLIKGRPLTPLTPEVLACFAHSIVDVSDERRGTVAPAPGVRTVTTVQAGARRTAEIDLAFQRGAVAVLGWPFDDPAPRTTGRTTVPPDVRVVLDLIHGVDRELPVARLEDVLKRDPTVAFRLMRYLNSPAFGLRVEINSFAHALMLLGYQRLKRWLAVLLASASKGTGARHLMFAAVRRGMVMEELGRSQGDAEMRGEMFICGVFSLLDRLLQQPFEELLRNVPVPERVQQALRGDGGPYAPYLELLRAIEDEAVFDIRECSEQLMLSPIEVNRAVLTALHGARQIDG